jgi:hypothetical protein
VVLLLYMVQIGMLDKVPLDMSHLDRWHAATSVHSSHVCPALWDIKAVKYETRASEAVSCESFPGFRQIISYESISLS